MASKRQRTDDVLLRSQSTRVSHACLLDVLKHVKENPAILTAATSRNVLGQAVLRNFDSVSTCLNLELETGTAFAWHVLLPQQLIPHLAAKQHAFGKLLAHVAASLPVAETWKCIVYHDELTPGNVLRPCNSRKFTAFYISFLQFSSYLRCEEAWLCVGVLRHNVLNDVAGHLSGACKVLLRAMFIDGDINCSSGFVVSGRLFIAELGTVIGDEAALKATWAAKGAAGMKPCLQCKNVVGQDSSRGFLQADATNYLVDITCGEFQQFDQATNDDIWYMCDRLQAYEGTKVGLVTLEKACGLNRCPQGILADQELRDYVRPNDSAYDSMHCLFSHGTAALELHLFLDQAKRLGIRYSDLDDYCKANWFTSHNHKYTNTFCKTREAASKEGFKGMASELLYVYPLVEQFAATIIQPSGQLQQELQCFFKMCTIVRLLQVVKMQPELDERVLNHLQTQQKEHLLLFCAIYGTERVVPKHHYSLHIVPQIRKNNILLDAFVLERKHIALKRVAENIHNLNHFERSVLARHFAEYVASEADPFTDKLLGATAEYDEIAVALAAKQVLVAEAMQVKANKIHVKDILLGNSFAYEVLACMRVDSSFKLLAQVYEAVGVTGHGKTWKRTSTITSLEPGLQSACFWSFDNDLLLTL